MDPVSPKILLVGKDSVPLEHYAGVLGEAGFRARVWEGGAGILDHLLAFKPHLVLSEIAQSGMDWHGLLNEIRESQLFIPVIFLVSPEALNEAVEAIKDGAADFLIRPFDPQTLLFRVRKALENRELHQELQSLQRELRFRRNQDYIVGASPKIQFLLGQIIKVATTDLGVLITGETGTGKELVARAIHYNSKRAGYPFITINCSAIPEQLIENELFGHVKGSYTGADATVTGLYEEAHGGTLVLDEVGDLPLPLQAKLLRVLESGEFRKIGGTQTIRADVRIIAATHKNLNTEIEEGRFREDLYYRLNTFPIHVPPLRERKEDIPLLTDRFFKLYQKDLNKKLEGFSASALQKLMFYHWPGNVREMENRIRQAMINANGPLVYREDIMFEEGKGTPAFKSFKEAKTEFEKNYVMNVLRITHGNVAEAARLAQKDRKDFYDVMRKFRIRSQDFRTP